MTSFRPRPIDIDKPLLIVRKELTDEEARPMPMLSTGMERHEENESHIRNAIMEAQRQSTRIVADIPTPIVRVVPTYEQENQLWGQPPSYIKVTPPVYTVFRDPISEPIEYDLDSEDEDWISNVSTTHRLSKFEFEEIMDTFEKALARQKVLSHKPDNNDLSLEVALNSLSELQSSLPNELLHRIYQYWNTKRSKFTRPLLISLIPPPAFDDPSPFLPFRPREKETKKKIRKKEENEMDHLRHLKAELEESKVLMQKIKKRETMKRDSLLLSRQLFNVTVSHKDRVIEQHKQNPCDSDITKLSRVYSFCDSSGSESEGEFDDLDDQDDDMNIFNEINNHINPFCPWDKYPEHIHNEEANRQSEVYWGNIRLPGLTPFRGRVRMGRGGRIFIDRASTRNGCHS